MGYFKDFVNNVMSKFPSLDFKLPFDLKPTQIEIPDKTETPILTPILEDGHIHYCPDPDSHWPRRIGPGSPTWDIDPGIMGPTDTQRGPGFDVDPGIVFPTSKDGTLPGYPTRIEIPTGGEMIPGNTKFEFPTDDHDHYCPDPGFHGPQGPGNNVKPLWPTSIKLPDGIDIPTSIGPIDLPTGGGTILPTEKPISTEIPTWIKPEITNIPTSIGPTNPPVGGGTKLPTGIQYPTELPTWVKKPEGEVIVGPALPDWINKKIGKEGEAQIFPVTAAKEKDPTMAAKQLSENRFAQAMQSFGSALEDKSKNAGLSMGE